MSISVPFTGICKKSLILYLSVMMIRKATYDDLDRLMEIFTSARKIMRESGNLNQWDDSSPSVERSTIRIDTHSDNVIMHHLLAKHGFTCCGIIRLSSGAPRAAFIGYPLDELK